ncbi:hypothetical protein KKP04_14115 [Rhodomicrobium sp. Az07]|uniref:hypothetical protein n=1 Tax=Rhodomicrobium sp. Az07 TaxID=2839034 RepID=UPI001BE7F7ED|nr:hypothetical protein [Rhodomicrobium sp. Az07]MBT3071994.1 hypothetical protein [Rhodomicrobium sp. Az07]
MTASGTLRRVIPECVLALLLFAMVSGSAFAEGLMPHPPKGKGEHCVASTDVMRRNHMDLMKHQRDETVHEGVRGKPFGLAGCVGCHAVKGADGQPVSHGDSRHFCRSCHDYAAVSIDCFQCHASRPDEKVKGAEGSRSGLSGLAAFFQKERP